MKTCECQRTVEQYAPLEGYSKIEYCTKVTTGKVIDTNHVVTIFADLR
jgi:hypothetical protein